MDSNNNNNIESRTNLTSANPKLDIPLLPLSLTQLIVGNLPIDVDNEIKSLNNEKKHSVPLDRNRLNAEDTLPFLDTNFYDNIDQLSFNESEKLLIQHDPVTDDIIVDPTPTTLIWEVLQEEEIVVDTTINSAIDGNNVPITTGGSTFSNEIVFTLTGEVTNADPEEIAERGFICTIDGDVIPSCGDPITGQNPFSGIEELTRLPGEHTFTVQAFVRLVGDEGNTFGNTVIFNWTINEEPIEVTTELSAVDGNEVPITTGGSTFSNEIVFTLTGEVTNADPEEIAERGFISYYRW